MQIPHCEEPIPKIKKKCSQKRNCLAPQSEFPNSYVCEQFIFSQPICLFCCRKYMDQSWENINRSQTHESGNWDWGRAIPRKGIQKWDFRCNAVLYLPLFFCYSYTIASWHFWQKYYKNLINFQRRSGRSLFLINKTYHGAPSKRMIVNRPLWNFYITTFFANSLPVISGPPFPHIQLFLNKYEPSN